jgi:hypothetical protein
LVVVGALNFFTGTITTQVKQHSNVKLHFLLKQPILWRDSISRPLALTCLVAGGDDSTRPCRQGM